MKSFTQWLEALVPGDDVKQAVQGIEIDKNQFKFDQIMLTKKFGHLENKYNGRTNLNLFYEEKEDVLYAHGFLVYINLYIGDDEQPSEFPPEIVQQVVNKYFTTHTVGLLAPAKYGGAYQVEQPKPNTPYLLDAETGEYWLVLEFPNAAQVPLPELEQKLDRYLATINKANQELEAIAERFAQTKHQ